jgi:signal peptidase II
MQRRSTTKNAEKNAMKTIYRPGALFGPLTLTLSTLLLDQASKALVRTLPLNESLTAIPGAFWITHVQNTGASFSILTGNNLLLFFIGLVALGLLIAYSDAFKTKMEKIAYALLLAGITGNLVDRVLFGGVTDLFDLGWFPVFNVADSALVIGVGLMILDEIWLKRKEKHTKTGEKKREKNKVKRRRTAHS